MLEEEEDIIAGAADDFKAKVQVNDEKPDEMFTLKDSTLKSSKCLIFIIFIASATK